MTLCSLCFVTTLIKQFDRPKYRPVRGGMFIFAGLSSIAIFVALGVDPNASKMTVDYLVYAIGGAVYVAGALIYIMRMPERCKPGAFDVCGASH